MNNSPPESTAVHQTGAVGVNDAGRWCVDEESGEEQTVNGGNAEARTCQED